jgi:molecular chaperone GrpE (heat shock protein)
MKTLQQNIDESQQRAEQLETQLRDAKQVAQTGDERRAALDQQLATTRAELDEQSDALKEALLDVENVRRELAATQSDSKVFLCCC